MTINISGIDIKLFIGLGLFDMLSYHIYECITKTE